MELSRVEMETRGKNGEISISLYSPNTHYITAFKMLKVPGPNYYDPWRDLFQKYVIRTTREWPAGTLPILRTSPYETLVININDIVICQRSDALSRSIKLT